MNEDELKQFKWVQERELQELNDRYEKELNEQRLKLGEIDNSRDFIRDESEGEREEFFSEKYNKPIDDILKKRQDWENKLLDTDRQLDKINQEKEQGQLSNESQVNDIIKRNEKAKELCSINLAYWNKIEGNAVERYKNDQVALENEQQREDSTANQLLEDRKSYVNNCIEEIQNRWKHDTQMLSEKHIKESEILESLDSKGELQKEYKHDQEVYLQNDGKESSKNNTESQKENPLKDNTDNKNNNPKDNSSERNNENDSEQGFKLFRSRDDKGWVEVDGSEDYQKKIDHLDTSEYLEFEEKGRSSHAHQMDSNGSTKLASVTDETGKHVYESSTHIEKDTIHESREGNETNRRDDNDGREKESSGGMG